MSRNRSAQRSKQTRANRRTVIAIAVAVLTLGVVLCSVVTIGVGRWLNRTENGTTDPVSNAVWSAESAELSVAVSPSMAPVLQPLADQFNRQRLRTPDGNSMQVNLQVLVPERMVAAALLRPPFQAVNPDSSLWLNQIDQRWTERQRASGTGGEGIGLRRVNDPVRYATSPIVIAAWESVARELGWPDQPVGWLNIQGKATADANFKWNHPSTNNASGMLATLAEFYAGAGLTRGLTEEAATRQSTLDYVQAVEATVRFYGEGEEVIVERLAQEGPDLLDAFVAQEQVVIDWNRRQRGGRLVAIYPAEGTLWTDHPLALLELGLGADQGEETPVTDNQRRTFQAFVTFLTSGEVQASLLASGYRPADLTISLDAPGSPFADTDSVDWRQPQTTLQIPAPAVVDVVQNVWYYTKRPTNVYLVVDTSGSMEGTPLARTQEALASFVEQIQGERDQVGIIEFGSGVKHFEALQTVDETGRARLKELIQSMEADGYTSLIDAVYTAVDDLQTLGDREAINALVVMTDGQENNSSYTARDLNRILQQRDAVPVVIFTIAFGADADDALLEEIARIGGGQFRRASETDIQELYRLISTYF